MHIRWFYETAEMWKLLNIYLYNLLDPHATAMFLHKKSQSAKGWTKAINVRFFRDAAY